MDKNWFWLTLVQQADSAEPSFAGTLILELEARDTAEAARLAKEQHDFPAGVICQGGPLLEGITPPADYTGRMLDEAEALEAKAAIERQVQVQG